MGGSLSPGRSKMAVCNVRPIRRPDFGRSNDVTGFPGVFRLGGTRSTPFWSSDQSETRKSDDVTLPLITWQGYPTWPTEAWLDKEDNQAWNRLWRRSGRCICCVLLRRTSHFNGALLILTVKCTSELCRRGFYAEASRFQVSRWRSVWFFQWRHQSLK